MIIVVIGLILLIAIVAGSDSGYSNTQQERKIFTEEDRRQARFNRRSTDLKQ